jgi:hypothetical protein
MPRKKKDNDDGGIKAFLIGLGLGTIGYAVLSLFIKPVCPRCKNEIKRNIPICPHCKTSLEWK